MNRRAFIKSAAALAVAPSLPAVAHAIDAPVVTVENCVSCGCDSIPTSIIVSISNDCGEMFHWQEYPIDAPIVRDLLRAWHGDLTLPAPPITP